MQRPVAVYDANVLYPAQLRDFLMRLATNEVVRAHWTERVHEEWTRNVHADYPDIEWDDLERIRGLMDEALPDACVRGYEGLVEELSLPDPDDRHVLAAAIRIEADYIVTFNTKDFPRQQLRPHAIDAVKPDHFASLHLDRASRGVVEVASEHRASLVHPSKSVEEYLDLLRESGLEYTSKQLREYRAQL